MIYKPKFNIVLWQPEIPNNTGNIGRTCVAMHAKLHLIKPLGFEITDKAVKRSGLDYWPYLQKEIHESWEAFVENEKIGQLYFVTTKADKLYYEVQFKKNDYFIFGKETKGLPEELMNTSPESKIRIPMLGMTRSLNLANSVAIVGYEALRQDLMSKTSTF